MIQRPPACVAGFPTHVTRIGKGVRRALFLHCTLGHSGSWTPVQAALLGKLQMTAFDRPGHGRSADWPGQWQGEAGGAALHRLTTRIALGLIDKRADLIGHSFGATVALRLAIETPEVARSLVLIEPPLFAAARGTSAFDAHEAEMAQFLQALEAGDRMTAAQRFNDALNPDSPFAALPEKLRTRMAEQIHVVADERDVVMNDAANLLATGRLEKITQPILLLEGTASPPIVRATHEALAARLPQVQRVLLVGAGHMSPITHPDNVAGEIGAFLKV